MRVVPAVWRPAGVQVAQYHRTVLEDELLMQRVRREISGAVAGSGTTSMLVDRPEARIEARRVEQRADVSVKLHSS